MAASIGCMLADAFAGYALVASAVSSGCTSPGLAGRFIVVYAFLVFVFSGSATGAGAGASTQDDGGDVRDALVHERASCLAGGDTCRHAELAHPMPQPQVRRACLPEGEVHVGIFHARLVPAIPQGLRNVGLTARGSVYGLPNWPVSECSFALRLS